jgi:cellulose synthase/poly-beta-1,6-N-acetylglucosamine synthase-like glycosyltransferase
MDLNTFLFYLFTATSIIYISHLAFYLMGASIYDMWQARRRSKLSVNRSLIRVYPHVTVLVPAHNEEKVIERCLQSIFKNEYPNFDVMVINDASSDATKHIVNLYAKLHPEYNLRVIHRHMNSGKGAALNYALRRYVKSKFVMMLDADSLLAPNAIERAISYFSDPAVVGVAANVQVINEHTTLSILQKFEHMIGYRAKKTYSLTNSEFVVGGVGSTYRTKAIRAVGFYDTDTMTEDISLSMKLVAKGNKAHRLVYAADVMAMTEPVETLRGLFWQRYRWKYGSFQNILKHNYLVGKNDTRYSSMLTIYRLPMAIMSEILVLLLPFTWAYAVYLMVAQNSLLLLLGTYVTVTAYMFLTLWYDEHLRFRERLYLTLYVPLAYFIFYIMDVIQILAVTLCVMKANHLIRHHNSSSAWRSPARIGGQVLALPARDTVRVLEKSHE